MPLVCFVLQKAVLSIFSFAVSYLAMTLLPSHSELKTTSCSPSVRKPPCFTLSHLSPFPIINKFNQHRANCDRLKQFCASKERVYYTSRSYPTNEHVHSSTGKTSSTSKPFKDDEGFCDLGFLSAIREFPR